MGCEDGVVLVWVELEGVWWRGVSEVSAKDLTQPMSEQTSHH